MSECVLDASVAVTAAVEVTPEAAALRARLEITTVHAPHLVDAEAGSVLRRRVAAGLLEEKQARGALRIMEHLVHERYPHGRIATRAWELRHNLSYYDALYAALAARLEIPLLTADARLANAPGLPCEVELIA